MTDSRKVAIIDGSEVEFDFEKGAFFRVIHVDGAFGGLSPTGGLIHMAVYNERQPIPKHVVHKIQGGILGEEIVEKRQSRSGLFREVEADLVMTLDTAIAIRKWLDERITQGREVQNLVADKLNALAKGKS